MIEVPQGDAVPFLAGRERNQKLGVHLRITCYFIHRPYTRRALSATLPQVFRHAGIPTLFQDGGLFQVSESHQSIRHSVHLATRRSQSVSEYLLPVMHSIRRSAMRRSGHAAGGCWCGCELMRGTVDATMQVWTELQSMQGAHVQLHLLAKPRDRACRSHQVKTCVGVHFHAFRKYYNLKQLARAAGLTSASR